MKKLLALLLVVVMAGSLFAGCGSKETASSEPAAAMLFGAVLYAETPDILSICGLCFTITAVILLNYERN